MSQSPSPKIEINQRSIGPDFEPYIIAELSGNHNGSLERALALVDAAAATGCDAIKLQTYRADTITIDCDRPEFTLTGGLWDGYSLYRLYDEAHTPWQWHRELFDRANRLGVTMFSTPFDPSAVDFLEGLNAPAYKIASFEMIDLPLVAHIAKTGKPIIMSTGMANLNEIEEAVACVRDNGNQELVLLHCVSSYPAPLEAANIAVVADLAKRFSLVSGLSDHTFGTVASVAAIAVGGSVIEKHFTLSRADGGPDAGFSLEPHEFSQLVTDTKAAHRALGRVHYETLGCEGASKSVRRSLYVVKDIGEGEVLGEHNIRSIRPGLGLAPRHRPEVLGRKAARDLCFGEPLAWDMIT
jgi:N-acetylneuraminate synthase